MEKKSEELREEELKQATGGEFCAGFIGTPQMNFLDGSKGTPSNDGAAENEYCCPICGHDFGMAPVLGSSLNVVCPKCGPVTAVKKNSKK